MKRATYKISLRVKHSQLEPSLISKRLRLRAKTSWKAGAQRLSPSGRKLGTADYSFCGFELKSPHGLELSDALALHVERLKKHKNFLREITTTGGTLEFYVGWFVERHVGDVFESELLKGIASMGIDLTIEVYGRDEKTFAPTIVDLVRSPH